MNRTRALPFLSNSSEKAMPVKTVKTIKGEASVTYTTTYKNNIAALRICGMEAYDFTLHKRMGTGVRGDDGSVCIAVRVHDACYLDGYEFARALKEKNSPVYQGEYDSEHFLYRATDEDVELFGDLDFSPGTNGFYLTMEADVPEGKEDITSFGIQMISSFKSEEEATREVTGSGPSVFKAYMQRFTVLKKIRQEAQSENFDIPIKYDSFKLYSGGVVPGNYNGFTKVFDIKRALYYAYLGGGAVYDEIELVEGKITRRIGFYTIDETTPINEASYDGVPVFAIPLPSDMKIPYMDSDSYYEVDEPYDLIEETYSFYIPQNDGNMYVFINEDITTVEEARKKLLGQVFYYQTEDRFEETEKLEPKIDAGVVVVEACTNLYAPLEVDYYE